MNRILRMLLCAVVAAIALLALPVRADPPDRVGRISLLSGDVEFRNADDSDGEDAVVNWPVTSGNVVATGRLARAEVRIGSTAVRLEEGTELEFTRLDDQGLRLRLKKGTVAVRMKNSQRAADFELKTPQGRLLLQEPGRYRFESDLVDDTTSVAAFQGSARFEGPNSAITVRSGQRLEVYGVDDQRLQTSAAEPDEFDEWSLARDRRDQSARALRFVSNEMTGYEDLDEYGDWRDSPEYGSVWSPRGLPSGWAPYRWGRWAWVEPWGWTWVDDMPWGFAPSHYGRWALVGNTWAWVPGRAATQPVYAPALVAWVGQPGWRVSFKLGSVSAVGWFPLAPREVYYPAYPCTTRYVRNVNVAHVGNVTQITTARPADVTRVKYRYRSAPQAVTVVATDAVARGRPVRKEVVAVKDVRSLAALPIAITAPAVTPAPRPFRARVAAPAAAAKGATSPKAAVGAPGSERGDAEARHRLRRDAGGQPEWGLERGAGRPIDRPVITSPARPVDAARDAPREERERQMPRTESRKATPGDQGVAKEQPAPRNAARKPERMPDGDGRFPAPSPVDTQQLREHGARRDEVRAREPSPVRAIPTAPVRSESRGPTGDNSQARPERRRSQQEPTPSAAPTPRPRPVPPVVPQRPAAAPEKPQRGMDAVQAQERGRRHDGQRSMGGMGGRESHSPSDAGKQRESGDNRTRPEPPAGAPRM